MIEETIENWHKYLNGNFPGGLDELLADDVEFLSPIVFSPQKGKDLTKLYLNAAGATVTGGETSAAQSKDEGGTHTPFRYIKEVMSGNSAVLEFETSIEGKYMNGVDIITVDDEGKIIEFKVMIRPLQAIQAVHRQMADMLKKMQEG